MPTSNPVLVEITRGAAVESWHRGAFAIADAQGRLAHHGGDPLTPVYPRSAAKPLQALPLIETGAAAALGFGAREIALACASHKGEPAHVAAVSAALQRLGLSAHDLECGLHAPLSPEAALELAKSGQAPTPLHHNCSGKHTGFLAACVHLGEPVRGYIAASHPAQRRVAAALATMTGAALSDAAMSCDGCNIPVFQIPLVSLATGMARLADPSGLGDARAAAATSILDAMAAEPFYVNGTGGFTTEAMRAAPSSVRVKGGFEGVYTAALPKLGLGVALKIDDGAMRAAECLMAALLQRLGCFDPGEKARMDRFLHPAIKTNDGRPVGRVRVTQAVRL